MTVSGTSTGPAERRMIAYLDRLEMWNGTVNAIVAPRPAEELLAEARAADRADSTGPLHGVPIAVKDMVRTKGIRTTFGSPIHAHDVPEADDVLAARMRAAGAIFTGKTNVPEFARGSHTFNSVYGTTVNPYAAGRTAGGSSGGAAVALATGILDMCDGSDVMGSLRNPAGWNNVYSLRPTWGRVPGEPDGELYWNTLSTDGPMGRTPLDVARLLDVMSGPHPLQPLSKPAAPVLPLMEDTTLEGLRIGYLADWSGAFPMEDGILDTMQEAMALMAAAGAKVQHLDAPFPAERLWTAFCDLRAFSDAAGKRALYDDPEARAQMKPEVLYEQERGRALGAMDLATAAAARSDWARVAGALFDEYDALILPTAQVWPFPAEWRYPQKIAGVQMDSYHRWMEAMVPVSILGLPAMTMPAGFSTQGWPIGMQVFGPTGSDAALLRLADAWHRRVDFAGVAPHLPTV